MLVPSRSIVEAFDIFGDVIGRLLACYGQELRKSEVYTELE